jgi:glutamate synthase domain-containing protein 3
MPSLNAIDYLRMLQALELVLSYEQDTKTLVVCTALNQYFYQHARYTAQRRARSLLDSWTQAVSQKALSKPHTAPAAYKEHMLQCLRWLCRTAGLQFVNSHDVACNLLHTFKTAPDLPPARLAEVLKDAGGLNVQQSAGNSLHAASYEARAQHMCAQHVYTPVLCAGIALHGMRSQLNQARTGPADV